MIDEMFAGHAQRALRGQWKLEDLPWDEPLEYSGTTKRDRVICRLDTLDLTDALYHFLLGSRARMGDHVLRSWSEQESLKACVELHDGDQLRHVQGFRRLVGLLRKSDAATTPNGAPVQYARLWRATHLPRLGGDLDRMLIEMLVDEAVTRTLLLMVAGSSHVPLVRALFDTCAQDDVRHVDYLAALVRKRVEGLSGAQTAALQARTVVHVARLQSAFRPHFRSFASVSSCATDQVATEIFGAASRVIGDIGPSWQSSLIARLIHGADRSPWLLWLVR
jgi:hypothetical protein